MRFFRRRESPPPPATVPLTEDMAAAQFVINGMLGNTQLCLNLFDSQARTLDVYVPPLGTAIVEVEYEEKRIVLRFQTWTPYDPDKKRREAAQADSTSDAIVTILPTPMERNRLVFIFQDGEGNYHERRPTDLM